MERFTISLDSELAECLMAIQHNHHDLMVSTLHAHLDHENCIESAILRGPTAEVRRFAEALIAERGVRHGKLNLVAVELGQRHAHGNRPRGHGAPNHHVHLQPAR